MATLTVSNEVNVSQYVDYEGYSAEYAYATLTLDATGKVTVTITGANIVTWRIKDYGGGTKEHCVGVGGARTGTFYAEDGKEYCFQIYSQTYGTYSNGDPFTVSFDSGSGGSGDDDDYDEDYYFYFTAGAGTKLFVYNAWDEDTLDHDHLMENGEVIVEKDSFGVWVAPKTGYQNAKVTFVNFKTTSTETWTDPTTGEVWNVYNGKMDELGDIEATSSASLKSYKLTASAGTGSYITVNRIASKKSGATIGVLKNGATIYHFDTLQITVGVDDGYDIVDTVVSGCTENSNGTFTVTGNTQVTVATELLGLVYIDDGTTFTPCFIFIDNGTNWEQCMPFVDDGTSWHLCS